MALLTLLGLALRLVWFRWYRLEGTDCDGAGYMDVARHLAAGAGYATNIFKYLYLPPAHLPQPDAHWNPLYPYLTAAAFRLFGESITSAKLVPLLFGVAVPPMVYLLGRALTGSRRVALLAGLVAVVHPVLVTWSLRIETEIATLLLVTWTFVLLRPRGWKGAAALGVVAGLAWWMKYQSGLLWGAIALQAVLQKPLRRSLRFAGVAALAFTLTIAPWLLRNLVVFGDPLYTDLRTDVISSYPDLGGLQHVWASVTPPPKPIPFLLSHASEVAHHVYWALHGYALSLPVEFSGTLLLIPFVALGLFVEARRWRAWVPPLFFGALLIGLFSLSTPYPRYIYSVLPLVIVLAASGFVWLFERLRAVPAGPAAVLRAVVAGVLVLALADQVRAGAVASTDRKAVWSASVNCCVLEHLSAASFIREHTTATDAVMSAEPYHAGYLYDRPTVNLPFDEAAIPPLCARYHVRYIVVSDRERAPRLPAWSDHPPPWARVVARRTVEEIAREFDARDYPHLSPVTIYEIDLADTTGEPHVP